MAIFRRNVQKEALFNRYIEEFWQSVARNVQKEALFNRYMEEFLTLCSKKCTKGGSVQYVHFVVRIVQKEAQSNRYMEFLAICRQNVQWEALFNS